MRLGEVLQQETHQNQMKTFLLIAHLTNIVQSDLSTNLVLFKLLMSEK